MALETGTYINDLAPSNPLSSDPAGQGDDHLRLIKSTVQATLPNMGAPLGFPRSLDVATSISSTWNTNLVLATSSATATVVLTLPPAASITAGYYVDFLTFAGAAISLLPSGAASINFAASFPIPEQSIARAIYLGTGSWRAWSSPSGQGNQSILQNLTVKGTTTLSATVVLGNGQLVFPATQNASANANTLDDYEEGTWTPTLTAASAGNLNVVYATRVGEYTKIGDVLNLSFNINTSTFTHTTASGAARISGLPFNPSGSIRVPGSMVHSGIASDAGFTQITIQTVLASALLEFYEFGSGVTQSNLPITGIYFPTGNNKAVSGAITYKVP